MSDDIADAFSLPGDGEQEPAAIAAALVKTDEAFLDLRLSDAALLFLMRTESKYTQDKVELGSAHIPAGFQGKLGQLARWLLAKMCGGPPDFILIFDAQWWAQATLEQRTALVDHELRHCGVAKDKYGTTKFTDDGRPIFAIIPHDLEEFNGTVEKFGAWSPDILEFMRAFNRHA